MSYSPIAQRYAKALLELATSENNEAVVGSQLESFASVYRESPELQLALGPSVGSLAQQKAIITKIAEQLKCAPSAKNFLLVLVEASRIDRVTEIARAYQTMLDGASGRVRATVTSATPLLKKDVTQIQQTLAKLTGKSVSVEAKVDPELLGGVVTTVGNTVLDGSLRTQLARLGERLANG